MVTINLSVTTKERFKILKLDFQAQIKKALSDDEFQVILLDKFEANN